MMEQCVKETWHPDLFTSLAKSERETRQLSSEVNDSMNISMVAHLLFKMTINLKKPYFPRALEYLHVYNESFSASRNTR